MSTDDPTLNFISPRVAAGVLFTDEQGRILMVVPSYKDYLDIPGGYVEHGETPFQGARREVLEELGIEPPIGRLLVADWWQDSPEANGGAKLLLVFDGGVLGRDFAQRVSPDNNEVLDLLAIPVDLLDQRTIPRLANRIRAALLARSAGTVYLEAGVESP